MKRTTIMIVTGTVLAGVVTAGAFAHGRDGNRMDHFVDRAVERLELDAGQEQAFRGTVTAYQPRFETAAEALRDERKALVEALAAGADAGAIELRAQSISTQAGELVRLLGAVKRDVDAVLDDEQRAELNEHLARMAEHGRRGHGRHGHGHRDD